MLLLRLLSAGRFHSWGKKNRGDVPLIYKKLDDPSELVREVSCGALAIMTGNDLEPKVELWRDFFKKNPELLKPAEKNPKK